jgi:hypothetical protein
MPLPGVPYGFSNLATGQVTSGATATQLNGGASAPASEVVLVAAKANSGPIYVGGSGVAVGTGLELDPGVPVVLHISNINALYVIGTGTLSWAALY